MLFALHRRPLFLVSLFSLLGSAHAEEDGQQQPGFVALQESKRGTMLADSVWALSGLDQVPDDVLNYACAKSFLAIKAKANQSPFRRKQEVREKAQTSCEKTMRAVETKYQLPGSHQASRGFCSELQESVDSAQDQGHIYGSVALADLFETAESYESDMNWHLFCQNWSEQARPVLQRKSPPKRRMLNMRRVRSVVHKAAVPPPEEEQKEAAPPPPPKAERAGKEPEDVAKYRTAEIVDLVATGSQKNEVRRAPSLLQEVEAVHPFGKGSGHLEVQN